MSDVEVLVVGAGVLGTSLACHLLGRGAGRVMVLDAATPAAATSGAGAGFVGLWAAGYADFLTAAELELERYSIGYYRGLPDADCLANGNLFLATTQDGWDRWVATVARHRFAPPDARQLTPAEVAAITGGVVAAGSVLGGVLHPGGIQVSAGRATRALAARVIDAGGQLAMRTRVTGLLSSGSRVTGARTDVGPIRARTVVLACGAWSNDLLGDAGWRLPVLRMVATRVISPPSGVPATMPTIMVPDRHGLWLRAHRSGLTWGNGDGYAPSFELDGPVFGSAGQPRPRHAVLVGRLLAGLGPDLRALIPGHDTSVGWWLQGVPVMTPDRTFLAGPVPGADGLYVIAGDNEMGITHGPGLGKLMAEVIHAGGSHWIDASRYRLDRFEPAAFPDEKAVAAAMSARRLADDHASSGQLITRCMIPATSRGGSAPSSSPMSGSAGQRAPRPAGDASPTDGTTACRPASTAWTQSTAWT
jgi:sarcosine oxidase, subunit beta